MDQAINDMPRTKHRLYVLCILYTIDIVCNYCSHIAGYNQYWYVFFETSHDCSCAAVFRLIFKHRVMTKAKLGRRVNMDIQKFKVL